MANELDGFNFEQRHGKARVRVARVWRNKSDHIHSMVEWGVSIILLSDCVNSYVRDDNSDIVATDTMKNTVHLLTQNFFFFLDSDLFLVYQ
jgi:urate oxidase